MAEDKYVGYITSRINQKKSFSCDLEKAARYASDLYNSNGSFLLIWHEGDYILFVCEAKANKNGICVRVISYKVFSDKDGIISEINGLPEEKKKAIYFYGEIDEFKSSFGRDDIVILEKEKFQKIDDIKSKVWFEDFVKMETQNKLQIGMEHCTIFKFFKTDSEKRKPIYIYVPLDQATLDSSFYENKTWREILPNEDEDCQIAGVKCKCITIEMNVDVFNNVFCMVTDLSGESKYSLVHDHFKAEPLEEEEAVNQATKKTTNPATPKAPKKNKTTEPTEDRGFNAKCGKMNLNFEKIVGKYLNDTDFVILEDPWVINHRQYVQFYHFCKMLKGKKNCKYFLLCTKQGNQFLFEKDIEKKLQTKDIKEKTIKEVESCVDELNKERDDFFKRMETFLKDDSDNKNSITFKCHIDKSKGQHYRSLIFNKDRIVKMDQGVDLFDIPENVAENAFEAEKAKNYKEIPELEVFGLQRKTRITPPQKYPTDPTDVGKEAERLLKMYFPGKKFELK